MKEKILMQSPLFAEMGEEELRALLPRLPHAVRAYGRGEFLLRAGEQTRSLGIVLTGWVAVVQEDFWGNRNIIARISAAQVFAESYACVPGSTLRVSVCAEEACRVLWMDMGALLALAAQEDGPRQLLRNWTEVLARKNLFMNEKITHLSQRTTREKLRSFLSAEAVRQGSQDFTITFSRQQLADYLSVDRSAMSTELGKMRRAGILTFHKNHFHLIAGPEGDG